jgi:hypothetical protein
MPRSAWRLRASARRVHRASFPDLRHPLPRSGTACRWFPRVSLPLDAGLDARPISSPLPMPAVAALSSLTLADSGHAVNLFHPAYVPRTKGVQSAGWTMRRRCLYRAMEYEIRLPTRDRDVGPLGRAEAAGSWWEHHEAGRGRRNFPGPPVAVCAGTQAGPARRGATSAFFGEAREPPGGKAGSKPANKTIIEDIVAYRTVVPASGQAQAARQRALRLVASAYRVVAASSLVRADNASLLVSAVSRKGQFMAAARTGMGSAR